MSNPTNRYVRNLEFSDLFFAGYGFIIGAGIFTLLPFIIKYGKGSSWFSFVLGGLICGLSGLSYAKLNQEFPTNDAEYAWIYEIFKKDGDLEPTIFVKLFANASIWIVMLIGLFNGATVAVGQANFINQYLNMPKKLLIFFLVAFTSIINSVGNKYSTLFNKSIMGTISFGFVILYILASKFGSFGNKIDIIPKTDWSGLLQSSFITIFAFNGFQSIVQLSEEAKDKTDIPKGIISSIGASTLIYAGVAISVIALIGLKQASSSITPISDAFKSVFGKVGLDVVNFISIIALFNTLMLIIMSRSRLLQKLSVRGLAPKIFEKLTSLQELFKTSNVREEMTGEKEETKKDDKDKITLPIYAIIAVSIVTYLLTFIKEGAIESLANITNTFIFFVFILVNILVITHYNKNKHKVVNERQTNQTEEHQPNNKNKVDKLLSGFPWYAYSGLAISVIYFIKSFVTDRVVKK